jgi:hypothetical protein
MSSEHDKAVLNCIFNPLLPVGELVYDELPHALQGMLSEFGLVGMQTESQILSIKQERACTSLKLYFL